MEPVDEQLATMTYDELVATGTVLYERIERCGRWARTGVASLVVAAVGFLAWCATGDDRWYPLWGGAVVWSWVVPALAARRARVAGRAHTAVYSECLRRLVLLRQCHRDEIDLIRRQLDARLARLRGEVHPADEWIREWEGRLR